MKAPRFTDSHRWTFGPYADSKASAEPGYLAARFQAIRERFVRDEQERKEKVREVKRRTG